MSTKKIDASTRYFLRRSPISSGATLFDLASARLEESVVPGEREFINRLISPPAPTESIAERRPYAPRQIMVTLEPDVVSHAAPAGAGARAKAVLAESVASPFRFMEEQGLIEETIPVFTTPRRGGGAVAPVRASKALVNSVVHSEEMALRGINLVKLVHDNDVDAVMRALASTPGVSSVERVPARWHCATTTKRSGPVRRAAPGMAAKRAAPQSLQDLWNLRAIGWYASAPLPEADAVRIAVLDTGVDEDHPALAGVEYFHDGTSAEDIIGHGTHVAGIIAATLNKHNRMQGICKCTLEVRKIFNDEPDDNGDFFVDQILFLRSLLAAQKAGAKVINLSIGGSARSDREADIFSLISSRGVTFVAAMGNEHQEGNPIEYPAAYPNVVAVGATDAKGLRAPFSNTGKHISLCAPGVNILSTLPGKESRARTDTDYAAWDGTSMATPHVSGAIGLLLAKDPTLDHDAIVAQLTATATKVPQMGTHARTDAYGAGLLNVKGLLT